MYGVTTYGTDGVDSLRCLTNLIYLYMGIGVSLLGIIPVISFRYQSKLFMWLLPPSSLVSVPGNGISLYYVILSYPSS